MNADERGYAFGGSNPRSSVFIGGPAFLIDVKCKLK